MFNELSVFHISHDALAKGSELKIQPNVACLPSLCKGLTLTLSTRHKTKRKLIMDVPIKANETALLPRQHRKSSADEPGKVLISQLVTSQKMSEVRMRMSRRSKIKTRKMDDYRRAGLRKRVPGSEVKVPEVFPEAVFCWP